MSIINQMLKDLERRDPYSRSGEANIIQTLKLRPGNFASVSDKNIKFSIIFLSLGVVIFILSNIARQVSYFENTGVVGSEVTDTHKEEFISVNSSEAELANKNHPEVNSGVEARVVSPSNSSGLLPVTAEIKNVWVTKYKNNFRLSLESSQSIIKFIDVGKLEGGVIAYWVRDTRLSSNVSSFEFDKQYINSGDITQQGDDVLIQLELKKGVTTAIKQIEPDYYYAYRLVIDFSKTKTTTVIAKNNTAVIPKPKKQVSPVVINKKHNMIRKVKPNIKHEQIFYQNALELLRAGRMNAAISEFQKVIDVSPTFHNAREIMASLLLKSGAPADAGIVLRQGLEMKPDHVGFAKMYGRLLADQGQYIKARAILDAAEINAGTDADYFALIAAVEQRIENHESAITYYVKALDIKKMQGVWWMGMGISLEAIMKNDEALQAYLTARDSRHLSNDLLQYVESRIQALDR